MLAQDKNSLSKLSKDSLAASYTTAEEIVKAIFAKRPSYNDLIPALLEYGSCNAQALAQVCGPKIHIPIVPMLGSPTRDLSEVVSKVGTREFTAEWKYDGQRAQVHFTHDQNGNPNISIFSRHLENITEQYPDVALTIPQAFSNNDPKPTSFVLEGEIVSVSRTDFNMLLPFQVLSGRAKKAIDKKSLEVSVCLFVFDLMFFDQEPLLAKPLRERRDLLRTRFMQIPGKFQWVKSIDAQVDTDGGGLDRVIGFFKEAVANKCEGLMVKLLDPPPEQDIQSEAMKSRRKETDGRTRRRPLPATYHPDKRVGSWLKVKKDYDASAAETLDLVPIAAWHGNGRKAKWWSPVLLAVRREEDGAFEAVCKCMSGFSDKVYKEMRQFYDDVEDNDTDANYTLLEKGEESDDVSKANKSENTVTYNGRNNTFPKRPALVEYYGPEPDIWFNPCEVWEIAFADITLSPTYTAAIGLVNEDRGLSLRFPRFVRKRIDKGLDEASSNIFLAGLWRKQVARDINVVQEPNVSDSNIDLAG